MRFSWRRRKSGDEGGGSEAAGPYATRYDIARQGYEMRVAQLAQALDQAALKNYLAAVGNIVLGIGIVTIALRGEVRPIFVPYDQMGRVIEYTDMDRMKDPPRRMVESELIEWLVAVRGIYYGDRIAQMDRARAAKAFLAPEAEQWLAQYYADPSRNPAKLQREISRTVELVSISRDPERNLWYLQWREIDVPARGAAVEAAWQGTLTVDHMPPASEDAAWANPTGIRISSIEWSRLRHQTVGSPRFDAAPAGPTVPSSTPTLP